MLAQRPGQSRAAATGQHCVTASCGCPTGRSSPARAARHGAMRRRRSGSARARRSRPRRPAGGPDQVSASRQSVSPATASTQQAVSTSTHRTGVSVPVPRPCSTATGQHRYDAPVHQAPAAQAEPGAQQAGDDEREHQVECDRAEANPDRPVRRDEGDERIGQRDRHEAVEHCGQDVHDGEAECEQRDIPVQP